MKPKLIAVVGTNASGKSGLGVELAARRNGEVISADSRQVFRGLDLGSGKITQEEMRGVAHHLLDVREPGEFFSMKDFQELAYAAIDDILARGKQPFLVGGTGLYVACVTEGYVLSRIEPDLEYRNELEKMETPELYRMLMEKMPDAVVDSPNNRNRVMRLLERIEAGDMHRAAPQPRYDVLKLGVTWDKPTLDARIDERLERRMKQGMTDEVRGLLAAGCPREFLYKLGLEYRFLCRLAEGEFASEAQMCEELARAIKQFARRQMTWFRRDPSILWLDMAGDPVSQALEAVDAFLARA